MTEKQTRLVLLRLQSPRLHMFCAALEQKILDGWQIQVPAREGNTMFTVTLSKEVAIDSELPTKALWNCNDQFEPDVLEWLTPSQNEAQELTEAPYPPVDTLELIPTSKLSIEDEFKANLQEKLDNGLVDMKFTLNEDLTGAIVNDILKESNEMDKAIKNGQFEELKFDKRSASGFIIKEYSLEEVQKLSWQDLTKLNSDLGLQKGKKPEMEANIVEASKSKWGNL